MTLTEADLHYFPKNYESARENFINLMDLLPGNPDRVPQEIETGRWKVPSPTDDSLWVDHAYLPARKEPERLFVIISGVHGLEGYAGSAIQSMFIREFLPKIDRNQTGIFLVHALNPFGYKYHRRGTENHVNLNRNCSSKPDLFQFQNPQSLHLSQTFIPHAPVDSTICHLVKSQSEKNQKMYFGDVSSDEFIKAVGIGQFVRPDALEYGGKQPEPQIQALIDALKAYIPQYKDIVLLDLHTGLGFRGRLHLLTGDVEGSVDASLFEELFDPELDSSVYDFTSSDTDGFYKTLGATNNLFPEIANSQQRVCALTMEFGTIGHDKAGQLESLNQWLLEHQGLFYGYADAQLEAKIKQNYLEKFFPSDPEWKKTVLATAREFFQRTFTRAQILEASVHPDS